MVVVSVISVLAALALPAFKRITQAARTAAVTNDLRVFAAAFTAQAHQAGTYPPETTVGVMPPLMVGSLSNTAWRRKTPVGGLYNWDFNRNHGGTVYRAAIAISRSGTNLVTTDTNQLVAIDRLIDDGNLTTGMFRRGAASEPVYIIER